MIPGRRGGGNLHVFYPGHGERATAAVGITCLINTITPSLNASTRGACPVVETATSKSPSPVLRGCSHPNRSSCWRLGPFPLGSKKPGRYVEIARLFCLPGRPRRELPAATPLSASITDRLRVEPQGPAAAAAAAGLGVPALAHLRPAPPPLCFPSWF
ncbi:uncharacterized protein LOC122253609 [Penaeus japonicus]|uniref:uncharacterized protein LOC122253609 n=1 Tax=Penaeus japonicus TaxID=27405 RepID=UPI001C70F8E2|nr:uncharacterized protein LOC122253609 [Penaeus japonicus]